MVHELIDAATVQMRLLQNLLLESGAAAAAGGRLENAHSGRSIPAAATNPSVRNIIL